MCAHADVSVHLLGCYSTECDLKQLVTPGTDNCYDRSDYILGSTVEFV